MVHLKTRLGILFFLSICFNGFSQTYLGSSKSEVIKSSYEKLEQKNILIDDIGSDSSYVKIKNDYETLYYYFIDDVCVEFRVFKPYSCQCLDQDIAAYEESCIAIGDKKWISKDGSKLYQMDLLEENYIVSVVQIDKKPVTETPPAILVTQED